MGPTLKGYRLLDKHEINDKYGINARWLPAKRC